MSRQYPHSDNIQPRFAAWLWACGLDIEPQSVTSLADGWQRTFMEWIRACIGIAYQRGVGVRKLDLSRFYGEPQLQVSDHEEFTETCWIIADEERLLSLNTLTQTETK